MAGQPLVSVIVCTRNRARTLCDTLAALRGVRVPPHLPAELLIVNNGSSDATRAAANVVCPAFDVRIVEEPRPGVARARNMGVAVARGRALLFLDDDVHPPPGWLEQMSGPILDGAADALAGGVCMAPHLERPWMETLHRTWLAETVFLDREAPKEMVGANMAFGRHVLAAVPGFDPELGPGALGQGEESLFSWQLVRAGFRLRSALDVVAEHHFDPCRLQRESFRAAAIRRGRVLAYQRHHWEHLAVPRVWRRQLGAAVRLTVRRLRHRSACSTVEGMPPWEMLAVEHLAFLRHWPREWRRSRHYERFGLRPR